MGTGIEPQRKPTGFGFTISILPTHCSSPELSIDDDGAPPPPDFSIATTLCSIFSRIFQFLGFFSLINLLDCSVWWLFFVFNPILPELSGMLFQSHDQIVFVEREGSVWVQVFL